MERNVASQLSELLASKSILTMPYEWQAGDSPDSLGWYLVTIESGDGSRHATVAEYCCYDGTYCWDYVFAPNKVIAFGPVPAPYTGGGDPAP